jgi:hypothetical protein
MREVVKLSAFILLIIGTLGLLVNEFVLDWGRVTTLVFAVFNFIGLAILVITYSRVKNKED